MVTSIGRLLGTSSGRNFAERVNFQLYLIFHLPILILIYRLDVFNKSNFNI